MQISPETAAAFRQLLIGDAARLVVAIISIAIGLAAILVQWLRRKTQDRVRLWFGLLALLYGYRALMMTDSAQLSCPPVQSSSRSLWSRSQSEFQPSSSAGGWSRKKHNRVTKSLLTINVLMAVAYLVFRANAACGPCSLRG